MGILVNDNGAFKIEVVREFADDIADSLEQGTQLSVDDVEELAQKAHEYFHQKWDEFKALISDMRSLDQSSYWASPGHRGMDEVFSELLHSAISKERLLKEIHSALV